MAGVLNNSGYGYGSGAGYGYGSGYDHGYGYGTDYGSNTHANRRTGNGYGSCTGEQIAEIDGHQVRFNATFGVIAVGCEIHTVSEWRHNWQHLARKYNCEVSEADVADVLHRVENASRDRQQSA